MEWEEVERKYQFEIKQLKIQANLKSVNRASNMPVQETVP